MTHESLLTDSPELRLTSILVMLTPVFFSVWSDDDWLKKFSGKTAEETEQEESAAETVSTTTEVRRHDDDDNNNDIMVNFYSVLTVRFCMTYTALPM